ncbi:MAG: enoyl-CoA hydratase [Salinisphaeraceae bacterium]|nr:enoyl-CoA hydratase [Salinisphaeraceae bacterium]
MQYQDIKLEHHGKVMWLTLNRPASLNALSDRMLDEMAHTLDRLDSDTRVLVFAAEGRAFCAGADLGMADNQPDAESVAAATDAFLEKASALFMRIEALPLPTIATVNGIALAGGLELILCCDLVIAAESAVLGDGHARYGLLPGAGGSFRLPRKVGENRAKYLMYTADLLPAATLEQWGLVNEVVADDRLYETTAALADKVAKKSPLGLARMKRLVDDAPGQSPAVAQRAELLMSWAHNRSQDRPEGLAAFREKREPVFIGS